MSGWKTGKVTKACNTFPDVWAAIVGCTGKGKSWRYTVGHFGRQTAEYACDTCKAAKSRLDALVGPAHTAELARLRTAAGVEDYRTAEVVRRNGRPVLTGRVDPSLAYGEAVDRIDAFAAGSCAALDAARAILAYGGDCKEPVRRACTEPQRLELGVAYRALRGQKAG